MQDTTEELSAIQGLSAVIYQRGHFDYVVGIYDSGRKIEETSTDTLEDARRIADILLALARHLNGDY